MCLKVVSDTLLPNLQYYIVLFVLDLHTNMSFIMLYQDARKPNIVNVCAKKIEKL